jgi:hypothetical protein
MRRCDAGELFEWVLPYGAAGALVEEEVVAD